MLGGGPPLGNLRNMYNTLESPGGNSYQSGPGILLKNNLFPRQLWFLTPEFESHLGGPNAILIIGHVLESPHTCGPRIMFHTVLQKGISSLLFPKKPSLCLLKPAACPGLTAAWPRTLLAGVCTTHPLKQQCALCPSAITRIYKPYWKAVFSPELINKPQSHNVCKTMKNSIIIYWELWTLQKPAHCIFRKKGFCLKKIIKTSKSPSRVYMGGGEAIQSPDWEGSLIASLIFLCRFLCKRQYLLGNKTVVLKNSPVIQASHLQL